MTVPPPKALRIGPKTVDCIFIGYAHQSSAHRFLVYESKNPDVHVNTIMEVNPNVVSYFENVFPLRRQTHATSSTPNFEVGESSSTPVALYMNN